MKWTDIINPEAVKISNELIARVKQETKEGKTILPHPKDIFKALILTPPEKVKVCIIGQDPYPTPGMANGLAFSVNPDVILYPKTLQNMFYELKCDIKKGEPPNGDLTPWAKQGVLLLNSSLTVYAGKPNSCANWGWQRFTTGVVDAVVQLPQPVVFILWGRAAFAFKDRINIKAGVAKDNTIIQNLIKKDIILSSHPSPLSSRKGCQGYPPFNGSCPFSKANKLLKSRGVEGIDWIIDQ